MTRGALVLSYLSVTDSGLYSCFAEEEGRESYVSITLNVFGWFKKCVAIPYRNLFVKFTLHLHSYFRILYLITGNCYFSKNILH